MFWIYHPTFFFLKWELNFCAHWWFRNFTDHLKVLENLWVLGMDKGSNILQRTFMCSKKHIMSSRETGQRDAEEAHFHRKKSPNKKQNTYKKKKKIPMKTACYDFVSTNHAKVRTWMIACWRYGDSWAIHKSHLTVLCQRSQHQKFHLLVHYLHDA